MLAIWRSRTAAEKAALKEKERQAEANKPSFKDLMKLYLLSIKSSVNAQLPAVTAATTPPV